MTLNRIARFLIVAAAMTTLFAISTFVIGGDLHAGAAAHGLQTSAAQGDTTDPTTGTTPGSGTTSSAEQPEDGTEDGGGQPGDGDDSSGDDPGQEPDDAPVDPVIEERETDISFWWWVALIATGVAAALGIVFTLSRRRGHEDWLHEAAAVCDTGHSVVKGLTRILAHPELLPLTAQNQARVNTYRGQVDRVVEAAPSSEAAAKATAVQAALQLVQEALADDAGGDRLDDLESARTALEHAVDDFAGHVDLGSVRASQPTSRASA